MQNQSTRAKDMTRITLTGSVVNAVLSVGKLLAGIFGRSGAMVADAVHSLSDLATDVIVLIFIKLSSKPKDESHDFGHGKFETLATVIIGFALFAVALGIMVNAAENIEAVLVRGQVLERPGAIALIAAVVSIISKEWLYRYTVRAGRRANSPAVIANAWHHRSDALSSIGTLLGIGGAYFLGDKWRILDPVAALIVAALIIKVSYDLIAPGLGELLEKSLPHEVEKDIVETIASDSEVHDPHNLKTRRIGSGIAIEIHVRLAPDMTVEHSHRITVEIEKRLKEKFGDNTQVIIHVEPLK